jgi:hypothetical protein
MTDQFAFFGVVSVVTFHGIVLSSGAYVLLLFALYIGRVQITPEYYPLFLKSVKIAFSISAALCFVGIFASIARGRTHQ